MRKRKPHGKFAIGDRVEFVENLLHENYPHLYPIAGSVGVILKYDPPKHYRVQWEDGAITYTENWYYNEAHLRRARSES